MKINGILEIVTNNSLNEATLTTDIARYDAFIGKLIKQVYSKSVLSYISSILPLKAPHAKIFALMSYYSGKGNDSESFTNTKIIQLAANVPVTFVEDGNISSSSGGKGKVLYIEDAYMLIKITSGTFLVGNNVDNTLVYSASKGTIKNVFSSLISRKKILKKYSNNTETSTNIKTIQHKTIDKAVDATLRKLKTSITLEAYQHLTAIYNEKAEDIIVDTIASEIINEIDQEAFTLIRSWAVSTTDLVLSDSSVGDGELEWILRDIGIRINKELAIISKAVGQNIDGFAVCSSKVVNALISCGAVSDAYSGNADEQEKSVTNNYIGKMFGIIDLIQDDFSDEDYVTVGYKGIGVGHAGLIYSPYTTTVVVTNDPDNGNAILFGYNRYALTRNPLDEGTGLGDSDYFRTFNVDFSSVADY